MKVLAVGAHPDDVEIGSAALLMKLIGQGHEVRVLILTDDRIGETRRVEALESAEILGVGAEGLAFLGLEDGRLSVERDTVSLVRAHMKTDRFVPDLVVTHSAADSHNDHRAANAIARAAFRDTPLVEFPIHLSFEPDKFAPRLFVKVGDELAHRKEQALQCFQSQLERIQGKDLSEFEASLGRMARLDRAEAFALELPGTSASRAADLLAISDSPFHKFWQPILGTGRMTLLYESYERPGSTIDWPTGDEAIGRDTLRDAFSDQWLPVTPLAERPSGTTDALAELRHSENLLLVGGALSNRVVRDVYNRLAASRFVVEYELPRTNFAYVLDKKTGSRLDAERDASGEITRDVGVLARIPNPYVAGHWIICAAGATSLATRRALECLANPGLHVDLINPLASGTSAEVTFACAPIDGRVERVFFD